MTEAKKLPQVLCAVAAGTGAMAAGATIGWFANIQQKFADEGLNGIIVSDNSEVGLIGSLMLLAALLMCIPMGMICDLIGRKIAMLIMLLPFVIGWTLIVVAQYVEMIFVGRFITGLSLGAFCVGAPLYTAEISDPSIRGALGTFFQLFLVIGILIAYTTGYLFSIMIHSIICGALSLVFFGLFFFQPETPVYLVKKGKDEAAKIALRKLRGPDYDINGEMKELKAYEESQRNRKVNVWHALKSHAAVRSIIIVFGSQFFQQMTGINAVGIYTSEILKDAGLREDLVPIGTIIFGIVNVIATYGSTALIDKFGRKILLMISSFFIAICLLVLGLFMSFKERGWIDKDLLGKLGYIAAFTQVLYIGFFEIGLGPIPWILAPELFPPDVKGILSSAAGVLSWSMGFIIAKCFMDVKDLVGSDICFYGFAVLSFVGVIFEWFILFETKGLTLEEIQDLLEGDDDE